MTRGTFRRVGWAVITVAAWASAGLAQQTPQGPVVAVLPVENLAGEIPPLDELRARVQDALAARGVRTAAIPDVDAALAAVRARWTGGIDLALAQALRERLGAGMVVLTAVELWDPSETPRLGLAARLVSLEGDEPRPLWAATAHLAGDDAPGFLARGLVFDHDVLTGRAVDRIAGEIAGFVASGGPPPEREKESRPQRRFRPRSLSVAEPSAASAGTRPRVAILSFRNQSAFPHAGEIAALEMTSELLRSGAFDVVERGLVRNAQLETRLIQEGGISIAQADLLRALLDVDLVLTGSVSEYQDVPGRPPVVDFTAYAVATREKRVGWLSRCRGEGNWRVFFFGLGEVKTAAGLTRELVRALLDQVASESK